MAERNEIDLRALNQGNQKEILIEQEVNFCKEDLENTSLLDLKEVFVSGKLERKSEEIEIHLKVKGIMILEDAISLEEVSYPFSIEISQNIEENSKKEENTLDLKEFLWENIVLEIPLKFTEVSDFSQFHGDGWKLVSEEEQVKKESPFSELLKDFGEE